MATIGYGYGSEWHMQRWLAYHRSRLNDLIQKQTGLQVIEWLDFGFRPRPKDKNKFPTLDSEFEHLNFLPEDHPAREAWRCAWPSTKGKLGRGPCWDAIAKLEGGGWLLVEAKAHLNELKSPKSQATLESLKKITKLMDKAKKVFKVPEEVSWIDSYYQQANRMTVLWFLNKKHKEIAHLLNICFTGDRFSKGSSKCPKNEAEWGKGISKMKNALGLSGSSALEKNIHYLYLPVTEA
ncbi:hypothetical protein [Gimesia chilikensis]|uniref:hypothetical protein n=1 Tax=Gimesia chilikensis TaxID=2605989 RepID=UPI00118D3FE3|nr:hypothetical protein [Gimesia chilikensis]QDT84110.1 hypothetical protein MalM14_17620 [Gimesia chilikensis]